jgi:hypothetical protein
MVAYSFKKRFIEPIMMGLGAPLSIEAFAAGMDEFGNVSCPRPKRQTIRAIGKRRHARPGETIQLYTAMRTKQCSKLGEARCKSVEGVLLKWSEWPSFLTFDIGLDGRRSGPTRKIADMEEFARSDGFPDFAAMRKFWADEHGPETFEGYLIKWERING